MFFTSFTGSLCDVTRSRKQHSRRTGPLVLFTGTDLSLCDVTRSGKQHSRRTGPLVLLTGTDLYQCFVGAVSLPRKLKHKVLALVKLG